MKKISQVGRPEMQLFIYLFMYLFNLFIFKDRILMIFDEKNGIILTLKNAPFLRFIRCEKIMKQQIEKLHQQAKEKEKKYKSRILRRLRRQQQQEGEEPKQGKQQENMTTRLDPTHTRNSTRV